MSDVRIRRRKRLRQKEAKALSDELSGIMGNPVFGGDDNIDTAEALDLGLIIVDNEIVGLVHEGKPFLSIRGIIKYGASKRHVTVDMGAVPFVTNGADIMGPGIIGCDPGIEEGDMVWIRDENHAVPIAIGVALRGAAELAQKKGGKAVGSLHNVGDKLWKVDL